MVRPFLPNAGTHEDRPGSDTPAIGAATTSCGVTSSSGAVGVDGRQRYVDTPFRRGTIPTNETRGEGK